MTALDVRQIADKDLKAARFPTVRQELRVVFAEAAFDRAVVRGDADLAREIGGVLVGELVRDESGPFLRVDATIDALHAEEKGAELTFTHATWEHIHKEMDSTHDGKKIVGWYHTHPGFGIFLSDRDQFIHASFFNLPFQIALVYDPKSKEHGVFAWREGQPARARRYWVGEREHVWDGARTPTPRDDVPPRSARSTPQDADSRKEARGGPPLRKAPAADAPAADTAEAARAGSPDAKSIVAAAIAALLLGGVGGFWYGTREARVALQQAEVELGQVRAEAVRGTIRELDGQLIGVLRSTLGNEAVRRPLDQVIADLDEAEKALADAPPPGLPEHDTGMAKIRDARARAQRIRDDRGDAQAALARLEEISRQGALGAAEITRDLGVVRAGLGALYAELAADAALAGDAPRAARLRAAAASVDPGNRARYEQPIEVPGPRGPTGPRRVAPVPAGPPPKEVP